MAAEFLALVHIGYMYLHHGRLDGADAVVQRHAGVGVGSGVGDTLEKLCVSPSNTMRMAMLAMPSLFFASFSVRSLGCDSSSQYTSMTTSASCSI